MSYTLDIGVDVQEQIGALPHAALTVLAEALVVLEITPWSGPSLHAGNPQGAVRNLPFGSSGMLTYLGPRRPAGGAALDRHLGRLS